MARKYSHRGDMGLNQRTCSTTATPAREGGGGRGGGLRLFGVQVVDLPNSDCHSLAMNKSFSMDCLLPNSSSSSSLASSSSTSPRVVPDDNPKQISNGYISADGEALPGTASSQPSQETRKGVPWSEEEHGKFLQGLEKLGRGGWRGISRNFVTTRTPTQVASHAQKYFLGLHNNLNKTRRQHSNLFDKGRDRLTVVCAKISKTRDGSSSIRCRKTHQHDHSRSNFWFSSALGPSKPTRAPDLELTLARAPDLELTLAAPTSLE